MSIALFKPFAEAMQEGERVWEKLVQKVVSAEEVAAHVAEGWHTDAATALEAANAAEVEAGNAQLQAQIDAANATLAKRGGKKAAAGNVSAVPDAAASTNPNATASPDASQPQTSGSPVLGADVSEGVLQVVPATPPAA